jgi:Zn finger protein HypA/HybF involved in hydrogenase expression
MAGGGITTREERELEQNPCREQAECEKCPDWFPIEELDENGYCPECVAGNEDARSHDRYFRSISR